MQTQSYNGWTNYETWLVKLWMDNEYGSCQYWSERVQDIWQDAEADSICTRVERATIDLADVLKQEHEENMPEDTTTGLWADLLNAALSQVKWYEIAQHLISDLPENIDRDADECCSTCGSMLTLCGDNNVCLNCKAKEVK